MSKQKSQLSTEELKDWRLKIATANRNNIFCHCRDCDAEWMDSYEGAPCPNCRSQNVESICCWQFPDG